MSAIMTLSILVTYYYLATATAVLLNCLLFTYHWRISFSETVQKKNRRIEGERRRNVVVAVAVRIQRIHEK